MTKLILVHGNGLAAISQKISSIKGEFDSLSTVLVSGKNFNWEKGVLEFSTPGLFSDSRLVVLEDFEASSEIDLEKIPKEEGLTVVLKYIKSLPANSVIIKQFNKLGGQIINLTEKDEVSIFPFLDMLAEKKKAAFLELGKLLDEYGGQYILTMIFYMLRRLVMKPKNLPEFVLRKIQIQKKNFSKNQVKQIYRFSLETDYKIKSGLLEEKMGLNLIVEKVINI